jgi:hypothetical protein
MRCSHVAHNVASIEKICAGLHPRHRGLNAGDLGALLIRWHAFTCNMRKNETKPFNGDLTVYNKRFTDRA